METEVCVIKKKKKEREREREEKERRERNSLPHPRAQRSPTNQMPFAPAPNLYCSTGGAPLCTPRSSPVATLSPKPSLPTLQHGKGLTPSSCSPDAGSGIHICVIINLSVSAGDGGSRGSPPSLGQGKLPSSGQGHTAQVCWDPPDALLGR